MSLALQKIEFAPDVADQVYRRLLDAICNGSLAPAARLTQEELAASLEVSRQPVIQALRMLKRDGFVIDAGKRGVMVAPLDADHITQLYAVRGVLDGLAARQAAEARVPIDRTQMEHGRRIASGDGVGPMIDADLQFHQSVYAASGNPLIAASADTHWRHIRRAMGAVLRAEGMRGAIWDEHEAILEAIAAGRADHAEKLARDHCEAAGQRLAAFVAVHIRSA
ncbi:MAG: GntR family transcriptional regulator [Burkholderiales bacterium]|nr:GntR family transcriptional regulator [Burkholderiales bacterium]